MGPFSFLIPEYGPYKLQVAPIVSPGDTAITAGAVGGSVRPKATTSALYRCAEGAQRRSGGAAAPDQSLSKIHLKTTDQELVYDPCTVD
jgi:hypothetical protein